MNAGLLMVMSGINYLAPGMGPGWLMVGSTANNTQAITNPNDYAITLTLVNNWTDVRFTWQTPGALVIPARGTANVRVNWSGTNTQFSTATSSVAWSVAGGTSGSATANAEHDNGA